MKSISFLLMLVLMGDGYADEKLPNVVMIITDDQGWADIGYNNPNVYTPNIDHLAKTGVAFSNHYVMPECTPTRVALMTGRFPSRFGRAALQASNQPVFPLGTPTISQMFKDSGYETFLCGKWHLGSSFEHGPMKFGFDHSYGSLTGAIGMYDHRYREGEFCETWHRDSELVEGGENGTHATDLVTNEAVRIISAKRDKPFFLYLPFHTVHTPLDERGRFVDRPTQLDPEDSKRWLNENEIGWFNDPEGIIQRESDPEKRLLLAAVNHLDHSIGRVVDALDKSGQRENTLILFSSDNGPQGSWRGDAYPDDLKLTKYNQPLPMRGRKTDLWEGGIHVPGFANWPGKIQPKVVADVVHIVDWFPTLANQIGHESEEDVGWDGVDISGLIFEDETLPDRDLYWVWNRQRNRWALRHGEWKIVKYGKGAPENADEWKLFNLNTDPKESTNVASENVKLLEVMHNRFLQQRMRDKQER